MEYRGIKLADNVKLFKKDGSLAIRITKSLNSLAGMLLKKGHKLLSEYISNDERILIDFKCGHDPSWVLPFNYKNNHGCNECAISYKGEEKIKKAKGEFLLLLETNNHKLLSEYNYDKSKVLIDFQCGHGTHWMRPNDYKNGNSCPKCSGKCPEQAKENLVALLKSNGHELLSEYLGNNKKVLIDFKCNHNPHWIEPNNYKNKHGCPACKESKGERRVRNWLEINDTYFESQIEFTGLVGLNGGNLSYDFYLPKQNILIEYQGQFHDGSMGEYTTFNLETQKEHDRRKREYAHQNGIELLEIWYWDYNNVEEVLTNKLIQ